jgi:hypothetical protein
MKKTMCIVGIVALSVFAFTLPASARSYIRALGGYGSGDFYGPGIGVSIGADVPISTGRPFFAGLRTAYHSGGSDIVLPVAVVGGSIVEGDVSQTQFAVEFGAVWMREPVIISTVGTLGAAWVTMDALGLSVESESKFLMGPGLLIGKRVGRNGFAGVEFKYTRVSDFDSSFGVFATFGGIFGW